MKPSIMHIIQNTIFSILILFGVFACQELNEPDSATIQEELNLNNELSAIDDLMWDDPNGALTRADQIIEKAKTSSNRYFSGKAKYYKAYIYDDVLQDVSKAYYHYNEALIDLQKTDSSSAIKSVYNNLGILYRFYGQYDAAFESYEKALELSSDLSKKELSNLYYNYGVALKVKGDEDSFYAAEEAFTKSLELAREIGYDINVADVNNQIGMMYKDAKDYDMARIAYRNNIRSYQGNEKMKNHVGRAYHGIGVTYMEEGNIDESVRAFEQALVYKTISSSIFVTKYDLGTVLLKGGYTAEATQVWTEALNEKHNKNDIEQVKIYAKLSEVLAANGEYKSALLYSQIFNESINKIIEEEKTYIAKNDKVLFEDVIKDYDEFNTPVPFYADIKIMAVLFILLIPVIYLITALYYRSKLSKKVSQTVSQIQNEFHQIKVD